MATGGDFAYDAKLAAGGVVNERLAERTEYASPNSKAYPAEAKRAYKARPDEVAAADISVDVGDAGAGDVRRRVRVERRVR